MMLVCGFQYEYRAYLALGVRIATTCSGAFDA